MGRTYDGISPELAAFLTTQPVFFVGTAPRAGDGHINVSPKGLAGSFSVVDPATVAYLDLTGSGIETVAHLRENGRIVLMFCAFDAAPRIVRLHGTGSVLGPGDPDFAPLAARFPDRPGVRSIIRVAVTRVSDSCGFGVPVMRYEADREKLPKWATAKGPESLAEYQAEKNARSIDGLPGIPE